jgi:prepilin-type N-terminal cleavage/methylation domain-containing protein
VAPVLWTALRRLRDEEDGFTLIELMVVVMILGILLVIGTPTFLGVRARFQDRAAQTDLRNVVLAARILYTDNATFTSANDTGTGLVTIVNAMCYVPTGQASLATNPVAPPCTSGVGTGSISVASTATQFSAARMSASQTCFVILDGTIGTKYGETPTPANCTATWAAANAIANTPAAGGW